MAKMVKIHLGYGIVFDISNITHRLPRSESLDFALGHAKLYFVHVLYSIKKEEMF